jgi:hypothetical protein
MNIVKAAENMNVFMANEELEDFKQYLEIAIEDLVNVRPENPRRYFALALCRAIPVDDSLKFEFPELEKELTFEETTKYVAHEENSG